VDARAFLAHQRRLQSRLKEAVAPLLRRRRLPPLAPLLLSEVERHPHPSEVGRWLGLPPPTVSRLLRELEVRGLVVRETVPEDLRRYRFRLTPSGREVQAEVLRALEEALGTLLARLTPEERGQLDRLLGKLAAGGDGRGAEGEGGDD
jgi:DNA-binding MarR family transcriptional regulator